MDLSRPLVLSPQQILENAELGCQRPLLCIETPAGGEAALGELDGKVLSVNGVYRCLLPIRGLKSAVQTHVRATLGGGATLSSSGPDTLGILPHDVAIADLDDHIRTAATGDGALSTGVAQTTALVPGGEFWALFDLTVASAGTVTITRAEWNGK